MSITGRLKAEMIMMIKLMLYFKRVASMTKLKCLFTFTSRTRASDSDSYSVRVRWYEES